MIVDSSKSMSGSSKSFLSSFGYMKGCYKPAQMIFNHNFFLNQCAGFLSNDIFCSKTSISLLGFENKMNVF